MQHATLRQPLIRRRSARSTSASGKNISNCTYSTFCVSFKQALPSSPRCILYQVGKSFRVRSRQGKHQIAPGFSRRKRLRICGDRIYLRTEGEMASIHSRNTSFLDFISYHFLDVLAHSKTQQSQEDGREEEVRRSPASICVIRSSSQKLARKRFHHASYQRVADEEVFFRDIRKGMRTCCHMFSNQNKTVYFVLRNLLGYIIMSPSTLLCATYLVGRQGGL